MNILYFIGDITESLAWPVTVIIITFLVKKPFEQLLSQIYRLKYQDLEIDFDKKLDDIDSKIGNVDNEDLKQYGDQFDEIKTIAEISPNSAILLAWSTVEKELHSIILRTSTSSEDFKLIPPSKSINILRKMDLIDSKTVEALEELRLIRNRAAHPHIEMFTVSTKEALRYYKISRKVISTLKAIEN